jgi:3'(2'), 5'-bisphosphate nucleotidase
MDIFELISIAKEAGDAIMKIYSEDFSVKLKNDSEKSPLTKADIASNNIICNRLEKFGLPILSEENSNACYEDRKSWKKLFIIDPLDGTKEFIKKNGEFTVNIALIEDGKPTRGVVYAPAISTLYYASADGAFREKEGKTQPIKTSIHGEKIKVVASKSHFNKETKEYIEKLGKQYELVNIGSSLKICLVAEA